MLKKRFLLSSLLIIGFMIGYEIYGTHFTLNTLRVSVEVHGDFDPLSYLCIHSDLSKEDITIQNGVDIHHPGTYLVSYRYRQIEKYLYVYVEDHQAPEVVCKEINILMGEYPVATQCIVSIKDDSPVTVKFAQAYSFNRPGDWHVEIIVKDHYGNSTRQQTVIHVFEKDTQAPQLQGIEDQVILEGDDFDLNKGITIIDDFDPNATYTIDSQQFDPLQEGQYSIVYTTKDRFGNTRQYTRYITVLDRYENRPALVDGRKVVYLTFDDGPSLYTSAILDILDEYQAKATFFVTGTHPDYEYLIKEAYQRGHAIGLHTYSHDYELIYRSTKDYFNDLTMIGEIVEDQIGFVPKMIRFPGGSSNQVSKTITPKIMSRLVKMVRDRGYQYYDWNCENGDAVLEKRAALYIEYAKTSIGTKDKIILLMHDGSGNEETVKALPQILAYLKKQGYTFEVLDETSPTFHHHVSN